MKNSTALDVNTNILKILLQLEGISTDWDENKVNRSSDGRFATKSSGSSSSEAKVNETSKTTSAGNNDTNVISAQMNKSLQYVTQQIGLAQRMTKDVASSFQKVLDNSVSQGVKLLQDLGLPVDKKYVPSQETIKKLSDHFKKEYIDKPIEEAKPLVKPVMDTLEKVMESPQGKFALELAAAGVAGIAISGLVILMTHLTPMMNLLVLYVTFKEISAFSKYQAAQYSQEKFQSLKQQHDQEVAQWQKTAEEQERKRKQETKSKIDNEKPSTLEEVKSKYQSIKDDADFRAHWRDVMAALHEKDKNIKAEKARLQELKDAGDRIKAKMKLDEATLLRLKEIEKLMYPSLASSNF